MAKYENIINNTLDFPFDFFVQDNLRRTVTVDEHWHDCFEILYMVKGSARQIINRQVFQINSGDILLIKSGDIHATYCTPGQDTQIIAVKFLPSIINESYSFLPNSNYIAAFLNHDNTNTVHALTLQQQIQLSALFDEISNEFTKRQACYDLCIKGNIYKLIAAIARFGMIAAPAQGIKPYDLKRIERILTYMESNFKETIQLKEVSDLLNFNYSYASRYFRKVTGKSFKEYLDFIRICEADKMMLRSDLSLLEISRQCGFVCPQTFHRAFQRVHGCTPTQYFTNTY